MGTQDDSYVAVRRGRLADLLDLAEHAVRECSGDDPQLAACLSGALAEVRVDIMVLA